MVCLTVAFAFSFRTSIPTNDGFLYSTEAPDFEPILTFEATVQVFVETYNEWSKEKQIPNEWRQFKLTPTKHTYFIGIAYNYLSELSALEHNFRHFHQIAHACIHFMRKKVLQICMKGQFFSPSPAWLVGWGRRC
jgi:hypothetical protein